MNQFLVMYLTSLYQKTFFKNMYFFRLLIYLEKPFMFVNIAGAAHFQWKLEGFFLTT